LVYPLDTIGGSTAITTISNGTIAHSINHPMGLRPFLLAIILPTMPAMMSSKTYLNKGILHFHLKISLAVMLACPASFLRKIPDKLE
jgi:hypothetical protein